MKQLVPAAPDQAYTVYGPSLREKTCNSHQKSLAIEAQSTITGIVIVIIMYTYPISSISKEEEWHLAAASNIFE